MSLQTRYRKKGALASSTAGTTVRLMGCKDRVERTQGVLSDRDPVFGKGPTACRQFSGKEVRLCMVSNALEKDGQWLVV